MIHASDSSTAKSIHCFKMFYLPTHSDYSDCPQCFDTVGSASGRAFSLQKLSNEVLCGYLSGARYRLFAYGPADANAIPKLASFKSRLVLPFWYRHTWGVLEKRPLNGCSSSSSHSDYNTA